MQVNPKSTNYGNILHNKHRYRDTNKLHTSIHKRLHSK